MPEQSARLERLREKVVTQPSDRLSRLEAKVLDPRQVALTPEEESQITNRFGLSMDDLAAASADRQLPVPAEQGELVPHMGLEFAKAVPRGGIQTTGTMLSGLGGMSDSLQDLVTVIAAAQQSPEAQDEFLRARVNVPQAQHPAVEAGREVSEFGREALPVDPRAKGKFAIQVGEGLGSVGVALPSFMAGGLPGISGFGAAVGFENSLQNAKQAGATDEEARVYAWAGALVGATTEPLGAVIPSVNILRRTNKASGGWLFKSVAKAGTGEGLQEVLQEVPDEVARQVYDDDRDFWDGLKTIGETALLGSTVGLIVGGLAAAPNMVKRTETEPESKPKGLISGEPLSLAEAEVLARELGGEVVTEAQQALIDDHKARKARKQKDPLPTQKMFEEAGFGRPSRPERRRILGELTDAVQRKEGQVEGQAQAATQAQAEVLAGEPAPMVEPAQPGTPAPGVVEEGGPFGRPALANIGETPEARALVDVIDEQRKEAGVPGRRPQAVAREEARQALAEDYVGQKKRLMGQARDGATLGDTDTFMARDVFNNEFDAALASEDTQAMKDAVQMMFAYRERRTDVARELAAGRDTQEKPIERAQRLLREAMVEPDEKTAKAYTKAAQAGKTDKAEQILSDWSDKIIGLKGRLRELGIDPDNLSSIADEVQAAQAVNAVQAMKAGVSNMAFEWFRNAILSAPPTQAVNFIGNTGNAVWSVLGKRFAEIFSNIFIRNPDSAQIGELASFYSGILPGVAKGWRNFWRTWRTEIPYFERELGVDSPVTKLDEKRGSRVAIPGKIGRFVRAGFGFGGQRGLLAWDEFFKSITGTMQAGAVAYRIAKKEGLKGDARAARMRELIDDPSSEAWTEAIKFARETAFQEEPGKITRGFLGFRREIPGVRYVLPFISTPASIFRQGLRQSAFAPVAVANSTIKGIREGDWSTVAPRAGEALIATGLMWLLMDNDPDNPWITGTSQRFGESIPPQSVRFPGTGEWLDYSRIEPFATMIASMVDSIEGFNKGGNELFTAPMLSVIRQAKNKTMLQGVGDVVEAVSQADRGATMDSIIKWASQFPSSFLIPAVVRNTARSFGESFPERRVWGKGQEWNSRMLRRAFQRSEISGLPDEPKIDMWGRDMARPGAPMGGPKTDIVWRMLLNIGVREDIATTADRMILNWNNANPGNERYGVRPGRPSYTVAGEKKFFTDTQYTNFLRLAGQTALQIFDEQHTGALADGRQINTVPFNIDDPTERDMDRLTDIINAARDRARRMVVGDILAGGQ